MPKQNSLQKHSVNVEKKYPLFRLHSRTTKTLLLVADQL